MEDTLETLNESGLASLPFLRAAFFDMYGTGQQDMIAGSKDGSLYLYRNSGLQPRHWIMVKDYFRGIKAGAFSSPAVGDLDGDGMPEVVVGTGGFSSDSGRLLFFKNHGTRVSPVWEQFRINVKISVGNDATPAIVDYNSDGRPDLIIGNSEGRIFFFRNIPGKHLRYARDRVFAIRKSFGMYAVPAAVRFDGGIILIIGNDMGKLFVFRIKGRGISEIPSRIKLFSKGFASPSFASLVKKNRIDLVIADGDGRLTYFDNSKTDFSEFKKNDALFNDRIPTSLACAPTISCVGDKQYLIIGNIDGTLRFYEPDNKPGNLPWIERKNYLRGISVAGFSRGSMAQWKGKDIIITGQGNGKLRAFFRSGPPDFPLWTEKKGFFKGIHIRQHSTPTAFDIGNDGNWDIITGAADGRVYAFRVKKIRNGLPEWERIRGIFDNIKVHGFSAPSIVRDGDTLYLFVGQQDGRIRTFTAAVRKHGDIRFHEDDFLNNIRMRNYTSPFVAFDNGRIDLIAGDYDGNIRHFVCDKKILQTGMK